MGAWGRMLDTNESQGEMCDLLGLDPGSKRAQIKTSYLGSDLSLWNMHNSGHFGGDSGGPPGAQAMGVTHMCHRVHV